MSPFQNSKLLTESQILQEEIAARTKESDNRNSQKPQEAQHQGSIARGQPRPIQAHLHDSTEELYFGERQLLRAAAVEKLSPEWLSKFFGVNEFLETCWGQVTIVVCPVVDVPFDRWTHVLSTSSLS